MNKDQQVPSKNERVFSRKAIRATLFLLPVLIYLPTFGGDAAVPLGGSNYSDLLITHYPYLLYLRNSIAINHQLPLWANLIQSGAPFAANPLAGIFYLPGWTAMLFPLPNGLSITLAAHVIFGTWGMYRFLRQRTLGETGSIIGALCFGLMPKLAAHFGAGHVTLLYAIAWTPWLLYCNGKDRKGWKTGMIAGMLFLADPRWSVYAGTLWLAHDIAHRKIILRKRLLYYLKASLIALLVSAPLLVPLLEYVKHATRTNLSSVDMLTGSLPIANLIGIIIPGSGGNIEWYFYSGGTLLAILASQVFNKEVRKKIRFWGYWIAISLFLSLGTAGYEIEWINRIPVLGLLRVPARSLFILGICFAVITGTAIDHISKRRENQSPQSRVYLGIIALGVMMMGGMTILNPEHLLLISWGFAFFTASGLLLLTIQKNPAGKYSEWLLVGILIVDLLGASLLSYEIQGREKREPNEIQSLLIQEQGYFRVYSPSYSVAQHLAAEHHLELADGVDPMQIAKYVEFMSEATGIDQDGYSVTIPPFETGNPSRDNINAKLDADLLGLLNVKYVISEFGIDSQELSLLASDAQAKIYLNERVLPRAWIEEPGRDQTDPNWAQFDQVDVLSKTANEILLKAKGPGKLVISEIQYPGWKVFVDGKREEISTAHEILRSVNLTEGEHQVVFKFSPISVYIGLILAAIGWAVMVLIHFGKFDEIKTG